MILRALGNYLQQHRQIALRDMALHFRTDEAVVRDMLQRLIAKGRVEKLPDGTSCSGGCNHCEPQQIEIYRWKGDSVVSFTAPGQTHSQTQNL